jgi:hypothetical protein
LTFSKFISKIMAEWELRGSPKITKIHNNKLEGIMPISLDQLIEDAQTLRNPITKYQTILEQKGFDKARRDELDAAIQEVIAKDSAQKEANKSLDQLTQAQEKAIDDGLAVIVLMQNAAKSAFGDDKAKLKEFGVGEKKRRNASTLRTTLEYMNGVAVKYKAVLLKNGMTQQEIDSIPTICNALAQADEIQENAKKVRNAATKARDKAAEVLEKVVYKARKFALAAFSKELEKAEEFKKIARSKKRGSGSDTSPPAPSPPPTT